MLPTFILALALAISPFPANTAGIDVNPAKRAKASANFSDQDLIKGFHDLAFGSDLRVGDLGARIRRFDQRPRFFLAQKGSVNRIEAYRKILKEIDNSVPGIGVDFVDTEPDADVTIVLLDEKQLLPNLAEITGRAVARAFSKRTDPQCITRVQSDQLGRIRRVHSFIVVDQGEDVFINCAYHETMHVFGLTNHSDKNRWTALNQNRTVASLSEYDRLLLRLLYDEAMRPGMSPEQVNRILPALVRKIRAK